MFNSTQNAMDDDHTIASQSDTTSDAVATASNEPTNHSPPAAENTHQMSPDHSIGLDQASDAALADPINDQTKADQRTGTSAGRSAEEASVKLENGLNCSPNRKGAHESSRSSSLNSDRQKVTIL